MATLEAVNGKAPSNAQIGDSIVTNGGTWKITGQNADGSWISEKVSDVSTNKYPSASSGSASSGAKPSGSSGGGVPIGTSRPDSFQGSASGITVSNDFQQAIIDQMNQNSAAWWEATTQEERDALHQQNQQLAGMLGGSVSYDSSSGKWSGAAEAPYEPKDQSGYLEEMYKAYLEQQKEALKQAYESNLSDLQAEQDKLSGNYQAAKNDTAAQSALSQQRYNETAAAYGLNTGTAGQAALSYSNQLQADISAMQAAESAANAEIERQRTNLGKEYQSALVQAQATNNYELFNALYQEAVRVDQALQQQSQFNASQAMQQYQMLLDKYYQDKQWGMTQEQWQYQQQQDQYEKDMEAAQLLAAAGDYSAYGKLFGWDQSKIDQMNSAWQAANTASYSGSGSSGGSGGGSSAGSVQASSSGYDALFRAAMESGYPESYINNNYKDFGFTSKTGLYDEYQGWYDNNSMTQGQFDEILRQIDFYFGNAMDETAMKIIQNNWDKIRSNPAMANQVRQKAKYFGYSISE